MSSLLPNNATSLERSLVQVAALNTPVPIRELWNPDTCPITLLPWLAWAVSVDDWDADWPEEVKRQAVRQSFDYHRVKGTAGAVRRAVDLLGAEVAIREWFETGGTPHTFRLLVNASATFINRPLTPVDDAYLDRLRHAVDNAKPARSHYDVWVEAQFADRLAVSCALQSGTVARSLLDTERPPVTLAVEAGASAACQVATPLRLYMDTATEPAFSADISSAAAGQAALSLRAYMEHSEQ